MSLYNIFTLVGILAEVAVIALLLYRRLWRSLPVFFAYCMWAFLSDALAFAFTLFLPGRYSVRFYCASTVIDSAMQFCVFVELAWSVLRPLRSGLSRSAIWVLAILILAATAAIWPFADIASIEFPSGLWHFLLRVQQTVSILRILFFLGLVACSQVLSLGWRDREFQIATGFGFYSLISVAVAAVNAHLSTGNQFRQLYFVVAASFLCSLLYWVVSFARQDAQRRAFTPQMARFLLALAESARLTRATLAE